MNKANRDRYWEVSEAATTRNEVHAVANANDTLRLDRIAFNAITEEQWAEWLRVYEDSLEILNDNA